MKTKQILTAVAMTAIMSVAISAAYAADAPMAPAAAATEKCYGVAKAGKDVAIELPAGVCEKLANGTLTAPVAAPAEKK